MALATVSIGSNEQAESNVPLSLRLLQQKLGTLDQSPWYQSDAVGFTGDCFINLVVAFETELLPEEINQELKRIENQLGRDRRKPRFSSRPIDLDLLTYADLIDTTLGLPRAEILTQAFVLKPLSDLLPATRHPETGESYQQLWLKMQAVAPELRPITPTTIG